MASFLDHHNAGVELPAELRLAIESHAAARSQRETKDATDRLSRRYREPSRSWSSPFIRSDREAAAYAAYRLPATYAATVAVLCEVRARCGADPPQNVLDVGGGPGTGVWAAHAVWPGIAGGTVLESNPHMIALGRLLARHSSSPTILGARWLQRDVLSPWDVPSVDGVIVSYLLGELPPQALRQVARQAWDHAVQWCVLIEPGTPAGYGAIREATDELAAIHAPIVAPFPADWPCDENEGDWIHFAQRLARSRRHRAAKGADLAYEDEKYAYVAASRVGAAPIAARVIRHPQIRSGHIRLVLCTSHGVRDLVVSRSDGEAFQIARRLSWGDALDAERAALFDLA